MANEMRFFLQTKQGKDVIRRQRSTNHLMYEPDSIYFDHFVSVRRDALVVKKFFIPSKLPYEFPWNKIMEITYKPQSAENSSNVRNKGMDNEGRWWALDQLRVHKRNLSLHNIRMKCRHTEPNDIGFTVVELDKFLIACRPFLNFDCKLSGCEWTCE